MQVILVYDAESRRTVKALKICRQYLHWVQRSVFEGQLSPAQLRELHAKLQQALEPSDSVVVYTSEPGHLIDRAVWGTAYGHTGEIL